ncbi:MAG: T9SS type A sorting domain-containing protein [Bacteroidetes bacterium]|nr:T9SS type A sorting domain-containing protein [Bacteroidota bacterium]
MKRKLLRFSGGVLLLALVANTASAQYCASNATSVYDTEIWNVTLVGQSQTINQSSGALGAGLSGTYTDYTAQVADVAPYQSYTISTLTGDDGSGPTYYSRRTAVYIDWNQDFDFLDAGELIGTSPYAGGAPISYNYALTVPGTAVTGNTRMRVVCRETSLVPASCGTYTYGETEDYTLNVLPPPTCLPVTSVNASAVGATSATIGWTLLDGLQTNWIIEYGFDGFTPGTGTLVPVITNPYVLTGLNPETVYDYYVYADCGGGDISYPSNVGTFTTTPLCPIPTAPNTTNLTSSSVDLNWTAGGLESLWDVEWGTYGFLLGTGVQDFSLPSATDPLSGLSPNETYHWYVRAVCDLNTGDGVDTMSYFVGPLSFSTPTACANPSALNVTNDNGFQADLGWTAGGLETAWNIQWGESGFPLGGTGSNLISNTSLVPAPVTGLTPNTSYQFYVQAICGPTPDELSGWVGPFTWTSATFCATPSSLGTSIIGTDNAVIDWTENGTSTDWTVEYGVSGFTQGTGTSVAVTTTPTTVLTGLTADTDYCFYVQSNCGSTSDSASAWAGPYCFTTSATCPAPSNLNAINITSSAANLLFQAGGSETMWDIEWGQPGFTPGTGEELGSVASTVDNPYYATGLNEAAPYQYYVRAVCGGTDGSSTWTGPYSFSTLLKNNVPCEAIEIVVNAPQIQHYNTGATVDAGEVVPPIVTGQCLSQTSWCSAVSGKSVWFTFKAPSTGAATISTFGDLTNHRTQVAVYTTGDCSIYANYDLIGANTLDPASTQPPYGSTLTLCSLIPGDTYYIKVDAATTTGPGNFGIEVYSVDPAISAGSSLGAAICENTGSFDLFQTITGNTTTAGTWYNPSPGVGNDLPNVVDFTGVGAGTYPFFYVDGSVCGSDTVETSVTVEEGPSAGGDNAITACNSENIYLIQHLTGVPFMGGTWTDNDATGALVNDIFQSNMFVAGTYSFTYTVTSTTSCPDASSTLTITLDDCVGLGISEEENNGLVVFPNPVSDHLTVQISAVENGVIEVFDLQGKLLFSQNIGNYSGNYILDMNSYEDGVYMIRVSSDNNMQEVRIVKN